MDGIQVKKRDGEAEAWSYDKLIASIGKSFIPIETAGTVAKAVEAWAQEKSKEGSLLSTEIRDKVIEELAKIDPVASENYRAYKKSS
jgi:transcriptional regulator NrdR family protein